MKNAGTIKILKIVLITLLSAVFLLLFMRFLFPVVLPFLLAFGTAWLLEPVVRWLMIKAHFKRGFASAICIFGILFSVIGFISFIVWRLFYEGAEFIKELPSMVSGIPNFFAGFSDSLELFISRTPESLQKHIASAIENMIETVTRIPAALSEKLISGFARFVENMPKVLLFCATYSIGSFFISSSFPEILRFIKRQIPLRMQKTAQNIKTDLLSGVGKWLKAQLMLMCITFLVLTTAFMLLKFRYAAVIAAVTAIIDALPVFGAGIVLLPWGVFLFVSGQKPQAIGLFITYIIVTIVKSCVEPKIVGGQFGINPAAALLAMYSGFKLVGITGMIFFPFLLMMLKQMNDKGYIKLWK